MNTYFVEITPSTTKRFNQENKTLIISDWDGWGHSSSREYVVPPEVKYFVFSMPDECMSILDNKWLDGWVFVVEVLYQNANKTRQQMIRLIPQLLTTHNAPIVTNEEVFICPVTMRKIMSESPLDNSEQATIMKESGTQVA